jgi:hypothetical protein
VAVGQAILSSGTFTVKFPQPLAAAHTRYCVFLGSQTGNAATLGTMTDTSGQFVSFVVNGTGTDTINWLIVNLQ